MGRKLHADTENQTDRQNYQLLHRQYRPPLNISNPLRVEKKLQGNQKCSLRLERASTVSSTETKWKSQIVIDCDHWCTSSTNNTCSINIV